MGMGPGGVARLAAVALVLYGPGGVAAQMYVYPDRGQSQRQQEQDTGNCARWATQQSGFDPANPNVGALPPPPPEERVVGSGAMARGAAGGAVIGVIGGAIGGSPGTGAAAGAAAGALFGGIRRAREIEAEQQAYQAQVSQQQAAAAQAQGNYNRAFAACMSGRGYTVR